ncbi:TPA: hypothetical protein DEG21_03790 [Patescibacteria group bacterium]|nr:hypothetical protein [Candidatus Gracilibacteria bacterium]HBY74972.1 hypothetical protein [Candidatus Gracilibacteria bacterium]
MLFLVCSKVSLIFFNFSFKTFNLISNILLFISNSILSVIQGTALTAGSYFIWNKALVTISIFSSLSASLNNSLKVFSQTFVSQSFVIDS